MDSKQEIEFDNIVSYMAGVEILNALNTVNQQIQDTQFKNGGLKLKSSVTVTLDHDGLSGMLHIPLDYASYVNDGRGEVRPVIKKFLRFWIDGEIIFTKKSKAFQGWHFIEEGIANYEASNISSYYDTTNVRFSREGF